MLRRRLSCERGRRQIPEGNIQICHDGARYVLKRVPPGVKNPMDIHDDMRYVLKRVPPDIKNPMDIHDDARCALKRGNHA